MTRSPPRPPPAGDADVLVVGGGAAGLATAIFARRANPAVRVAVLDGAERLGAKILVSGGGRCNVTNRHVSEHDFRGGNRHLIRRVLAALPVPQTRAFFAELGVALHEEERGKLFPDANDARVVLNALLAEARRVGVELRPGRRVSDVSRAAGGFRVTVGDGAVFARRVVLATGGMSLPKTGSDGAGYAFARRLGHSIVATVPALAPLVLEGEFHRALSGIACDAVLTLRSGGRVAATASGPLLWTHFGVSGPAALDISGAWHRARLEACDVSLTACFAPGGTAADFERSLADRAGARGSSRVRSALPDGVPGRLAEALLAEAGVAPATQLAQLPREARRRVALALTELPLPVRDSRGYTHAEVTSGGVALEEIDTATMESRVCAGLHLAGEMLDVDGRLGGYNFQWAWASGFVAGSAAGRAAR